MRLIDADALVRRMEESMERSGGQAYERFAFVRAWAIEAPTIDAVEVVRCENCDYWHRSNEVFSYGMCTKVWMNRDATFYCKSGERKTDG